MQWASSRKGVSEVIAAMALISITVAACVAFTVYASGMMGRLQAPVSQNPPYAEQLSLVYYQWLCPNGSCSSSYLTVTIMNDGEATITLVEFFVQGVKNSTGPLKAGPVTIAGTCDRCGQTVGVNCPSPSAYVLQVGVSCTLTWWPVPSTVPVTSGVQYLVKLVAKDGTIFAFWLVAGSYTH